MCAFRWFVLHNYATCIKAVNRIETPVLYPVNPVIKFWGFGYN